jgi:spermidine synthase
VSESRETRFVLVLLCFFLSGFAALLYQTAWTREFAFVFGTSDLAVAAVLAAYMGGLALGAAIAARFANTLKRPVLVYGLLELGIALCALAVPYGMRGIGALTVAVLGGGETAGDPGAFAALFRLITAFALLLPPTALMGATLPLLTRHAVRSDEEVGPRIGALYATNTAGAIAGTLCAAFLLLPTIGLRQTVYLGALVNGLVFVAAALVARGAAAPIALTPERTLARSRVGAWVLPLMTLSGAVSFSYEVLWTRLLSQILGGSVYAFSTMLASFLLGITLGSAIAGRLARTREGAAIGFAWVQIGTAVLALGAFAAANQLPGIAHTLGAGGLASLGANATLAGLVLLPFATCIGATFPFAVRIVTPAAEASSESTARVYAWNTVGSILGAIGAGFFLLPWLGFLGMITLGCAVNLGIAAVTALASAAKPKGPLLAAALGAVALAIQPIGEPWNLLRSTPMSGNLAFGQVEYFSVGRSSTVLLLDQGRSWRLLTNGLPESVIQKHGANPAQHVEARWLGFLPTLVRPQAQRALLIGLGGGIALEGMPDTLDSVDVIELEPEVVAANEAIGPERQIDPLVAPRANVLVNDARGALMLSETKYDAVVSQPSHPWTAGASHLYTREFFELVREHMSDDGVLVQWIGVSFVDEALLKTLVASLLEVFPHVQVYQPVRMALLFAASNEPIDFVTSSEEALRIAGKDLGRYGIHYPEDAVMAMILDAEGSRKFAAGAAINTDDDNLLATRSSRLGSQQLTPVGLAKLIRSLDPLPSLAPRLEVGRLARRMGGRSDPQRIARVAEAYGPVDREIMLGWSSAARGRPRAAERHFRKVLETQPDSLEAHAGLLMSGARVLPTAPAPVQLVDRARKLAPDGPTRLAQLDAELAAFGADSPLFVPASRLRIGWRLRDGSKEAGREALSIADRLIERGAPVSDFLLRARGARMAGDVDAAWSALTHIVEVLRPNPQVRAVARQALEIAKTLPGGPKHPTRKRLARLAQ